jgi:hypothetical protein
VSNNLPHGLDAARTVAEMLPSETQRTATIMEVAQRRQVLLDYLQEAFVERQTLRRRIAELERAASSTVDEEGRLRRAVEAFLLAKGEGHRWREAAAIDAMRAALPSPVDEEGT